MGIESGIVRRIEARRKHKKSRDGQVDRRVHRFTSHYVTIGGNSLSSVIGKSRTRTPVA